jgi:hypothetical protein
MWRRLAGTLLILGVGLSFSLGTRSAQAETEPSSPGPTVVLDHLEFPVILGASKYEKHLRKALRHAAADADWGAGPDSTIEYRFTVKSLTVEQKGDVLTVKCTASGTLPRGRHAQSKLSFGGSPREHSELIRRVLTIVARGVITRLAEIERVRRGKQREARVVPPVNDL